MLSGLELMAYSSLVLFGLVTLFHIESVKGDRIVLGQLRPYFDRGVLWLQARVAKLLHYVGAGSARILLHYIAHSVLVLLRAIVRRCESYLDTLARRNRHAARAIVIEKNDSHLGAVAEHKKATQLTVREKNKLKKVMLEG